MGYREYLKDNQAYKTGLLKDVQGKVREVLSKFGTLQREWLAELEQIRAAFPETLNGSTNDSTVDPTLQPARREGFFSSHEDALSTLFPNRITSFFPEHIQRQLVSDQRQIPVSDGSEGSLDNSELENIEEEPTLTEIDVPQRPVSPVPVLENEDESLQRIRSAFRKLSKPSGAPADSMTGKISPPLATELNRVMNRELANGSAPKKPAASRPRPRVGRTPGPLLDERRLDRMNEGNFQMLLRNNKNLSNNINRLADSYFHKSKPDEEGSWIPGI